MKSKVAAVCCLVLLEIGCLHPKIGPNSLAPDRAAYSAGISDSWKQQTLLNIVKLRYIDAPVFVDISSITTGYSLSQNASAGVSVATPAGTTGESFGVGASMGYSPTISYSPLTGAAFIQGLLTPLPPAAVFAAVQNGERADLIMMTTLFSINGLRNKQATLNGIVPADPNFERVEQLVAQIQRSGAVKTYVKPDPSKGQTTVVSLRSPDITPETLEAIRELRTLLKLRPDAEEFTLVQAPYSSSDTEFAIMTRSIWGIMQNIAADVQVPSEDLANTYAFIGYERYPHIPDSARMIRIQSGKEKPPDVFVAVSYRNSWFWIEESDLRSKQVFQQLMTLFNMADTAPRAAPPTLTIPVR
jgi:hypothetical protein